MPQWCVELQCWRVKLLMYTHHHPQCPSHNLSIRGLTLWAAVAKHSRVPLCVVRFSCANFHCTLLLLRNEGRSVRRRCCRIVQSMYLLVCPKLWITLQANIILWAVLSVKRSWTEWSTNCFVIPVRKMVSRNKPLIDGWWVSCICSAFCK